MQAPVSVALMEEDRDGGEGCSRISAGEQSIFRRQFDDCQLLFKR